jgi:hypothetical protein
LARLVLRGVRMTAVINLGGNIMKSLLSSVAVLALTESFAHAQTPAVPDNLEKLSNFQTTGTTEFTLIEQTGEYADGVKKNLESIKLPPGFKIELYAIVPDARHMAVGRRGSSPSSAPARTRSGRSPTVTRTGSLTK